MSEIIFNTCFDGTEISFITTDQSSFIALKQQTAVQLKDSRFSDKWKHLDFKVNKITDYEVSNAEINIYGVTPQIHNVQIDPTTYNILFCPNLYVDNEIKIANFISMFDEVWTAGNDLGKIVYPDIFFHRQIDLDLFSSDLVVLCHFPKYGLNSWRTFIKAYLQSSIFENAEMIVISDIWAGQDYFYNIIANEIKEFKNQYHTDKHKIQLLYEQIPAHIDYCIMRSDMTILPFTGNSGWNLFAAKAATLSKQVILTSYSHMAQYIQNCDIVMDLPIKGDAADIYKNFFDGLELNRKTHMIDYGPKFSEIKICQ